MDPTNPDVFKEDGGGGPPIKGGMFSMGRHLGNDRLMPTDVMFSLRRGAIPAEIFEVCRQMPE